MGDKQMLSSQGGLGVLSAMTTRWTSMLLVGGFSPTHLKNKKSLKLETTTWNVKDSHPKITFFFIQPVKLYILTVSHGQTKEEVT